MVVCDSLSSIKVHIPSVNFEIGKEGHWSHDLNILPPENIDGKEERRSERCIRESE